MSVWKRQWKGASGQPREAWVVDVQVVGKDGKVRRVRRTSPAKNRRAADRLEHEIREELLLASDAELADPSDIPTLSDFASRFLDTYAVTNNKPSEIESKRTILRVHLRPVLGDVRLDQIGSPEIEAYKAQKLRAKLARKTINNHLTVLRKMLSVAAEWRILPVVPPIKWLRPPPPEFDFLTFVEAHQLIGAADDESRAMITVALRTGLRLGELTALRWLDVRVRSFETLALSVRFSVVVHRYRSFLRLPQRTP